MISLNNLLLLIQSKKVDFVDCKFTDMRGVWHHMTLTAHLFNESTIRDGIGFDGSSIRGLQDINDSDMLLIPDVDTIFLDPFHEKTACVICSIYDPFTRNPSPKDVRHTAKKAEQYLKDSKIGTVSFWGPEIEFFLFDSIHIELNPYSQLVALESRELPRDDRASLLPGDGYRIPVKGGYFPSSPFDKLQKCRSEIVRILEEIGIEMEMHHHEVASCGQVEIDMKYDTLVKMADNVMIYKYVARNVAALHGFTANFMAKPVYGDNGSGMHTHQSVFKNDTNVFYDRAGYAELSHEGMQYTCGLLDHISSLLAFSSPTVNSYRRLVPHFEAPTAVAFSARNRSAAVRIPMYQTGSEKSKRLEFRCPDPTCNPYLSFSSQLIAGLDGIIKKSDPKKKNYGPFDRNIWDMTEIAQTPGSLYTTIEALKKDMVYTTSRVFSEELVESYCELKFQEARELEMYPTPADFYFYSDL